MICGFLKLQLAGLRLSDGDIMNALLRVSLLLAAGAALSGCAAAGLAVDAVSAGATVVSTTADVAGDVVSTAADTVSGSDEKKTDDKE